MSSTQNKIIQSNIDNHPLTISRNSVHQAGFTIPCAYHITALMRSSMDRAAQAASKIGLVDTHLLTNKKTFNRKISFDFSNTPMWEQMSDSCVMPTPFQMGGASETNDDIIPCRVQVGREFCDREFANSCIRLLDGIGDIYNGKYEFTQKTFNTFRDFFLPNILKLMANGLNNISWLSGFFTTPIFQELSGLNQTGQVVLPIGDISADLQFIFEKEASTRCTGLLTRIVTETKRCVMIDCNIAQVGCVKAGDLDTMKSAIDFIENMFCCVENNNLDMQADFRLMTNGPVLIAGVTSNLFKLIADYKFLQDGRYIGGGGATLISVPRYVEEFSIDNFRYYRISNGRVTIEVTEIPANNYMKYTGFMIDFVVITPRLNLVASSSATGFVDRSDHEPDYYKGMDYLTFVPVPDKPGAVKFYGYELLSTEISKSENVIWDMCVTPTMAA